MVWTPFDGIISLVQLASASPAAQKVERDNVASTLVSLRAGLMSMPSDFCDAGAAKRQFSNAASDLFCHQRVSEFGRRGQLDHLSTQVEAALQALQHRSLNSGESRGLLTSLDTALESLQ